MTDLEKRVLEAARKEVESESEDGEFGSFYIDNVSFEDLTGSQLSGVYSQLEQKGLYRKLDGYFGEIKL